MHVAFDASWKPFKENEVGYVFNTGYSVLYGVIRGTNVSRTDVNDPNSPGVYIWLL